MALKEAQFMFFCTRMERLVEVTNKKILLKGQQWFDCLLLGINLEMLLQETDAQCANIELNMHECMHCKTYQ